MTRAADAGLAGEAAEEAWARQAFAPPGRRDSILRRLIGAADAAAVALSVLTVVLITVSVTAPLSFTGARLLVGRVTPEEWTPRPDREALPPDSRA